MCRCWLLLGEGLGLALDTFCGVNQRLLEDVVFRGVCGLGRGPLPVGADEEVDEQFSDEIVSGVQEWALSPVEKATYVSAAR